MNKARTEKDFKIIQKLLNDKAHQAIHECNQRIRFINILKLNVNDLHNQWLENNHQNITKKNTTPVKSSRKFLDYTTARELNTSKGKYLQARTSTLQPNVRHLVITYADDGVNISDKHLTVCISTRETANVKSIPNTNWYSCNMIVYIDDRKHAPTIYGSFNTNTQMYQVYEWIHSSNGAYPLTKHAKYELFKFFASFSRKQMLKMCKYLNTFRMNKDD